MSSTLGPALFSLEHDDGGLAFFSLKHGDGGHVGFSLFPDLCVECYFLWR
jgi:hypothetical protein